MEKFLFVYLFLAKLSYELHSVNALNSDTDFQGTDNRMWPWFFRLNAVKAERDKGKQSYLSKETARQDAKLNSLKPEPT